MGLCLAQASLTFSELSGPTAKIILAKGQGARERSDQVISEPTDSLVLSMSGRGALISASKSNRKVRWSGIK